MRRSPFIRRPSVSDPAFTLIEMLVSISVLALLIGLVAQLINSAGSLTLMSGKHLDADSQARLCFDRMAVDFAQMVRRSDVDCYLKTSGSAQSGNDQITFFSEVPGYYPTAGSPSSRCLVSYRVNSIPGSNDFNSMERLGKGLVWNSDSTTTVPMVFLPQTITATWPATVTPSGTDTDYESIGSSIFRFEYYYVLKSGTLSATPWNTAAGSTSLNGWQDVAGIGVAIAVIDSKTRTLISDSQIGTLVNSMDDFNGNSTPMKQGDLEYQWANAISSSGLNATVASSIRVYGRTFYFPLSATPP